MGGPRAPQDPHGYALDDHVDFIMICRMKFLNHSTYCMILSRKGMHPTIVTLDCTRGTIYANYQDRFFTVRTAINFII